MRGLAVYAGAALIVVALGTFGVWPFVGSGVRGGLLVAGALAVVVQTAAYGVLLRGAGSAKGFLPAFVGGALARLLVVGGAGVAGTRMEDEARAAGLILGLVGFLFVLIVLEPLFLLREKKKTPRS